ncbi:MAG: manganese catalase [Devosia sp.]|nr:manganese catalase [Devosia sp.]
MASASWNNDFITTTGNVIFDMLHNFHLECGARLYKLRVYETLSNPTGREFAGIFRSGSVHAHSNALAMSAEWYAGFPDQRLSPS